MVTIKEAEVQTGITKQNIRYYEKMGLLHPDRDQENQYRKYSEEDIRRLKLICIFRKLDMPLEEIRQVLDERKKLQEALHEQKNRLEEKRKNLEAAISFCGQIREMELENLDVDVYLQKIETEEQQGNVFADILNDYKKVVKSESIRSFSFSPDDFCTTPRQMTEQLFQYAREHNLNLVITKEGLSPEFTIDEKEYRAHRSFGRFGMVIHAELLYPEKYRPTGISEKRYHLLRTISRIVIPVFCLLLLLLPRVLSLKAEHPWEAVIYFLLVVGMAAYLVYAAILYKNYRG